MIKCRGKFEYGFASQCCTDVLTIDTGSIRGVMTERQVSIMSDTIPQNNPQGKHYVYALAYPDSMGGRIFYIGKGSGRRIKWHEVEARSGKDENPYKCNVIRKILSEGKEVVKTILAYFASEKDAFEYEIALIFFMDGLTNLNNGGEGQSNPSEEIRRKMSESHKKLVVSKKTREKRRVMMLGNNISKGVVKTEETRQKLSKAHKGRIVSEKTRAKLSEVNKGKRLGEETKRKIS